MGGVSKRLVGALIDPSVKKILSALRSPRKCAHKICNVCVWTTEYFPEIPESESQEHKLVIIVGLGRCKSQLKTLWRRIFRPICPSWSE